MSALTLEDGLAMLRQHGCAPTDDRPTWLCPRCRTGDLNVSQNGGAPGFTCGGPRGCDDVGTWLTEMLKHSQGKDRATRGPHVDHVEVLRHHLQLPELQRIVKDGRRGENYQLVLQDGRVIAIGGVAVLTNQTRFRNAVLPQLRRLPPRLKPAQWDDVAEHTEQAAEERDTIASAEEEAVEWIADWLRRSSVPTVDLGDAEQLFDLLASPPRALVTPDGRLCLRLPELLRWIAQRTAERISTREMSTRLAALGFTKPSDGGQLQARRGSEIRKARYWISRPGFGDRL